MINTRAADIRKATKPDPLKITNQEDDNVHPEDWQTISKCIEFLKNIPANEFKGGEFQDSQNWMLYVLTRTRKHTHYNELNTHKTHTGTVH